MGESRAPRRKGKPKGGSTFFLAKKTSFRKIILYALTHEGGCLGGRKSIGLSGEGWRFRMTFVRGRGDETLQDEK